MKSGAKSEEGPRIDSELPEHGNLLQAIVETAPQCIKLLSSDGTLLTMNPAGLAMIEADSVEQVKGKSVYGLIQPKYRDAFKKLTADIFQGNTGILEFEIVGLKGKHLWLETHAVPLRNDKGKIVSLLGITRDITVQKHTDKALKKSEAKYRSLIESTDDSIYLIDRNYRYIYMNKKHKTRMGFSEDEYIGCAYGDFHSPEETKEFIGEVSKVFETGESIQQEHRSRRDKRYFSRTLSPVKDDQGKTVASTVISKDITLQKELEEKLHTLSITDELTGLYNRRGLLTWAEQLIKLADRQKKGMFMLYADMDNLKLINDNFGHQAGDTALKEIANILKATYRESDIIARIGGDEFVVIPIGTSDDNIEEITARLQRNLENHNATKSDIHGLSISFGISYYDPESPYSINEMMVRAEESMYKQKKHKQTS